MSGEFMKLKRRYKFYLLRLFRIKASPHAVAMGITLGFIPHWFPTFGIGPILSVGLAKLGRANLIAAAAGGIIGTPLWPLCFYLNYRLGSLLIEGKSHVDQISEVEYIEAVNHTLGSLQSGSLYFLIGAIVNIVISSIIIYFISFWLFKKYRLNILLKLRY
jgi:uncharacterized protein